MKIVNNSFHRSQGTSNIKNVVFLSPSHETSHFPTPLSAKENYRFLYIVRQSHYFIILFTLDLSDDVARAAEHNDFGFEIWSPARENKVSESLNASAIGRLEQLPLQKIIHDRGEDRH